MGPYDGCDPVLDWLSVFSGDVSAEEYARNATGACGSRLENRAAPRARIAREAGRVIKDIVSVMGDERGGRVFCVEQRF